jgi:polysaccharide pyruvyl transferase WcaK-like protein
MFSRDHMSIESIRQLWKKNETVPIVNHSPDVAFLIEYEDAYDRAFEHWIKAQYAGQTTVGINASGLLYSEWNSGRNRFGLRKSYEHTILTLCEALLERGHRLILIPHVYNHPVDWDNPSPENDLVILTRLYEKLHTAYGNNVFLVECNYSPAEIRRFIKQCDFFIGTRMHSCIASMSFHIPTVALAYSDKYSGVFSSLGVLESVFDLRKSSNGTMVHDILQLIDSREATRTILETGVPLTKAKIYSAFKEISNLIH